VALIVRKEKKTPGAQAATTPESRGRSLYYSLLLHAALITVFVVGIEWKSSTVIAPASAPQVMNATAVDAKQVADEVKKLKSADEESKRREAERQAEAVRKVKEEEQKLARLKEEQAAAKKQKEAENRRLEEERKQLEIEKEHAAAAKAKAEADKKKVEEEAKRAAEAEQKRQAEAKAQAEAERKQREEEAKKKAEEEKRKAEAAKAEAALQEAMAQEEAEQTAAAQAQADATAIQRYIARLTAAVAAGFVYPPGLPPGLKCMLFVRVIPGGDVVEARVVQSSGNPVFDRQAETAVRKASPLPMPEDPRLANQLREFNFLFDPGS